MLLQNILRTMGVDAAAAAPAWEDWDGSANGLASVFESANSQYVSSCVLSDTKVLVAYQDGGNSSYGTAVILTISGTTITAGTPVVFESANSQHVSSCVLSDTKVLVAYQDAGNSYYGTAVILTISGTTITAGTPVVFESSISYYISACVLSDTKVLVAYCDAGNSYYGTAIVLQSNIAADKLYIEDVFATTLYTGTAAAKAVTTGVSLSGAADGLIWLKSRSAATDHALYDTVRGATYDLVSNITSAQATQTTGLTSFNADGFSLGALAKLNTSAATYAAWTFKKRAKFFDVVKFSVNRDGSNNLTAVSGPVEIVDGTVQLTHTLGVPVGMVAHKNTGTNTDWYAWHRGDGSGLRGSLNLTNTLYSESRVNTGTVISLGNYGFFSTGTYTYVAYLWAHDDSADGVVQCGGFTTDASGNASVTLGWEPQYIMLKVSSTTGNWITVDNMRGIPVGSNGQQIYPNMVNAETAAATLSPTATGFDATTLSTSQTYIYLAIRRGPMRVPTDGTKVYNAIARTGTGAAATVTGVGFAPDYVMEKGRSSGTGTAVYDRLRGAGQLLLATATSSESNALASGVSSFNMDGVSLAATLLNASGTSYIDHFFRRAPGFFDIVCDTGTGVAHNITHGLKSVPGMIWRKGRSGTTQWEVWHSALAASEKLVLNDTAAKATDVTAWNSTSPTASVFSVGTGANVNTNAATYVTYLFGDTPGLCKAFSYTGNGTNQDVALGFVPRFIILKRTDSTGDWFVYDTVRGIVSGNDPYLMLNSTAAEVTTTDYIDPIATGFNVSGTVLNINASTYIGWACA